MTLALIADLSPVHKAIAAAFQAEQCMGGEVYSLTGFRRLPLPARFGNLWFCARPVGPTAGQCHVLMSTNRPAMAAAAAICGDTRCVRPR
jgi:hypothetical protein